MHIVRWFTILLLLGAVPGLVSGSQDQSITPDFSRQLIERIQAKTLQTKGTYDGIEFNEDTTIQTFDAETEKLQETVRVLLVKRNFHQKDTEVVVLKYEKDGKEQPLSDYKPMQEKPQYEVFAEDGDKYYDVDVVACTNIDDKKCYRLKITPKEKTARHIQGDLYYTADTLDLVRFEGTIAEFTVGLKELHMVLDYRTVDGIPVPLCRTINLVVHMPIVFPHKKMVIETVITNQKIIYKSEA
ncbi:MAG TPA: hypothetical protein PLK94_06800 [Alphaproteobacteria bacterium]|nr:hypothetical protein [Alphaproteobacteria bacterium]HPQ43827.1 hypothetical protein [Syntrophales bacterium]